jgi:uncharacterized protein involved in response to NO
LAAVTRVFAALFGCVLLVALASAAWVAAFGGFALLYGPCLARNPPPWSGRC